MPHPQHHHIHIRKRIHVNHEQYPHPVTWKRYLDKVMIGVGLVGPIITLIQIQEIWAVGSADGVSVVAWIGYACLGVMWLFYGIVHKEMAIIAGNIAGIAVNIAVVLSALHFIS